jgi:hypothetical protein
MKIRFSEKVTPKVLRSAMTVTISELEAHGVCFVGPLTVTCRVFDSDGNEFFDPATGGDAELSLKRHADADSDTWTTIWVGQPHRHINRRTEFRRGIAALFPPDDSNG